VRTICLTSSLRVLRRSVAFSAIQTRGQQEPIPLEAGSSGINRALLRTCFFFTGPGYLKKYISWFQRGRTTRSRQPARSKAVYIEVLLSSPSIAFTHSPLSNQILLSCEVPKIRPILVALRKPVFPCSQRLAAFSNQADSRAIKVCFIETWIVGR
jgi:hypothetical protein